MKQHAFCFRFETTKERSNQNKKSIKFQNQNFKFDFEIFQNYIWNFLISRFTPTRKKFHIYVGTFKLRTLPCPRTLVHFAKERSFLSRTKV